MNSDSSGKWYGINRPHEHRALWDRIHHIGNGSGGNLFNPLRKRRRRRPIIATFGAFLCVLRKVFTDPSLSLLDLVVMTTW